MIAVLGLLHQVSSEAPEALDTPSIDWAALWPGIILILGGILLLTISSLAKRYLF